MLLWVTETQTPIIALHCLRIKAALFRVGQDRAGNWTKMPTFEDLGIV